MAEGGTQGIQQKNVDNSTENCINESKRQRKWECQEWHVADETGMIQKRREKKHIIKNQYKEDQIRTVSGGFNSENELKLEKNAEDNKRNY